MATANLTAYSYIYIVKRSEAYWASDIYHLLPTRLTFTIMTGQQKRGNLSLCLRIVEILSLTRK